MRSATITRETAETRISAMLNLDGTGVFKGSCGIGFFDHMLNLLARHAELDIELKCKGDLDVDNHHTIEDLGIVLGQALDAALGDKKGIVRYGCFFCPMDEALSRVVVDLSGRPYLVYDVNLAVERIGAFETETLKEFLCALAVHARMNLHVACLYGSNAHHIVESVFKGLGHALREAVTVSGDGRVLSTKGVL